LSLANLLPEEPDASCPEPVALLRIRCPDGRVLNRRFLAAEPLKVLLTYVGSAGFEQDTYKLLTTYPRKDVSTLIYLIIFYLFEHCVAAAVLCDICTEKNGISIFVYYSKYILQIPFINLCPEVL